MRSWFKENADYLWRQSQLAAIRAELMLLKAGRDFPTFLPKANFNPNQPRVPAGNPDGGQWTNESGGNVGNSGFSPNISDEIPDPVIPGAQYAQVQIEMKPSALTGISTIDDTTKSLTQTLAGVVDTLPQGSGPLYGMAVHAMFANIVRFQSLRGIGYNDVETTFSLLPGARYGSRQSIRTDVILRNDVGDIIAIYDVKTGGSEIRPSRAAELRAKTGAGPDVPVIELNVRRGVRLKGRMRSLRCRARLAQY